jgi:hypothetical protein
MRPIIHAALLFAMLHGEASAEPMPQPGTCRVTIARAPDDVRATVEAWVRSEPQCSVALEIRVVPTEGGLYLLAQDERGRMRERIVPDAQTAGVLVASWIADDNAPQPQPLVEPVQAPPPTSTISPEWPTNESLAPPGLAPATITAAATTPVRRSRWLSVGALFPLSPDSGLGLRVDADLFRRGRWTLGAAVSAGAAEQHLFTSNGGGELDSTDYKLMAVAARTTQTGRWHLRPALGVGLIRSEGLANDGTMYLVSGTFPTAEASFMLSRELGKNWAVYMAPTATLIVQEYTIHESSWGWRTLHRGLVDLALFSGVRHRL